MFESVVGGPPEPASLVAFLERAGVTKSSVIRVTGPSSLPALLWFCSHGYDHVGYVRAGQGAPHDESPDAILVAHTCGEPELKLILAMARQVRPGGVLILRLRTGPGLGPIALERLLEAHGLTVESRVENGRRALIVARRDDVTLRRAA
jgi:hypothetical protein